MHILIFVVMITMYIQHPVYTTGCSVFNVICLVFISIVYSVVNNEQLYCYE